MKARSDRRSLAKLRAIAGDTRGAAMAEFAVVVAILLSLVFGVFQYGTLFFVWNNMFDAAREGARSLAVGEWNETEAEAGATAMLVDWPSGYTVVAQDTATTGTNQVRVVITVAGSEAAIVNLLPTPAELRAEVVMRKE